MLCAAWGRSLLVDVVERSVPSGSDRKELHDQLLHSLSASTKSFWDHFPAYAVRIVLLNAAAFAACPTAIQQLRSVFVRVFCTPFMHSVSLLQIAAAAVCCFGAEALVDFLLPRRYPALADAQEAKDISEKNTLWKHCFHHLPAQVCSLLWLVCALRSLMWRVLRLQLLRFEGVPMAALTESALEKMEGEIQRYLRARGDGKKTALLKETLASIEAADAKATFNLPARSSPASRARAGEQLARGLLFIGAAAAVVEPAFAAAEKRFESLRPMLRRSNGRLAVCAPDLDLQRPLDALALDLDVVCLCDQGDVCAHDFDMDWD